MHGTLAIVHVIRGARWLWAANSHWMGIDIALALVPLVLAVPLFRSRHRRGPAWWTGVAAFIVFLPNAPYVVTDVIHLLPQVHYAPSRRAVALGVLPLYAAFTFIGVESYVLSIRLLRRELQRWGRRWLAFAVEGAVHTASIFGVLLGRVYRLNSWDVLHPAHVISDLGLLVRRPDLLALTAGSVLGAAFVLDLLTSRAWRVASALRHS